MIDFSKFIEKIKVGFKKEQLRTLASVVGFDSLKLASSGLNDIEGYQIFTPEFIVRDMCAAVGDDIFNFEKMVLEPTSGDGAFTTYILRKRLEKCLEFDNFEINSLKALSTIYSIEMDKELIEMQRNNIFTVMKLFITERNIKVHNSYLDLTKVIISTNFIWAMFNTDSQDDFGLVGLEVAYKMPNAEKGDLKALDMPVWKIEKDDTSLTYEGVEIW